MSIQVETIDMQKVKEALKDCPVIIKQYVKALENVRGMQQETIKQALKKIRELHNKIEGQ